MGSSSVSERASTLFFALLLLISSANSFYLPGVAPRDFQRCSSVLSNPRPPCGHSFAMTKMRKLNRPTGHRISMLRTMVSQLVRHERIETTVAKAKEIRRLADNMVQLGKEGTLSAARRAGGFVRGDDVLHKLFTELAYRYKDRAGGYTRLLRTRIRVGDAAPMAYIEFIDRENELRQSKPPTPQPPQRVPLDPWTKSQLSRQFAPPKEDKHSESDA